MSHQAHPIINLVSFMSLFYISDDKPGTLLRLPSVISYWVWFGHSGNSVLMVISLVVFVKTVYNPLNSEQLKRGISYRRLSFLKDCWTPVYYCYLNLVYCMLTLELFLSILSHILLSQLSKPYPFLSLFIFFNLILHFPVWYYRKQTTNHRKTIDEANH